MTRPAPALTRAALLLLALGAPTRAQDTLLTWSGLAPGDGLGTSLAAIGDVDGDGRLDVLATQVTAGTGTPWIVQSLVTATLNRWSGVAVASVDGVFAAAVGDAVVHGAGFDPGAVVHVDGAAVPTTFVSSTELRAALAAGAPGTRDVAVFGAAGEVAAPGALARWPRLVPGAANWGGTLRVTVDNGDAGLWALAYSLGDLPAPVPLGPTIHHGLELLAPTAIEAGAIPPGQTLAVREYPIPAQPGLIGLAVHLQGFATQSTAPLSPAASMTDAPVVVVE